MKKLWAALCLLLLVLGLTGCNSFPGALNAKNDPWKKANGNYVLETNVPYASGTLLLHWVNSQTAVFEFDMQQGSENENGSSSFNLSGVLDLKGHQGSYDLGKDGTADVILTLDGSKKINVRQVEPMPLPLKGTYTFANNATEVKEGTVITLIRLLPGEITTLNRPGVNYILTADPDMLNPQFYSITAQVRDRFAARFLAARDLSSIWLQDKEMQPHQIYGETGAQPPLLESAFRDRTSNLR